MRNTEENSIESYKFLWRSDPNPWSDNDNATWSPYYEGDNAFLNVQYQLFLKNPKTETTLGNPPRYQIDFYNWVQININDKFRQRPIKRRNSLFNIIIPRFNRVDSNALLNNVPKVNLMEEKELAQKKGMMKIKFAIIKNQDVEIEISEKIFELENKIIKNYENWIFDLKNEISNLGQISLYQNKEHPYKYEDFLKNLSQENFYSKMIRMYTKEGFLYKEINNLLRNCHKNSFQNIYIYYISLMASLRYYSQTSIHSLEMDGYVQKDMEKLVLFRGSGISENEIKMYEKDKDKRLVRQMLEFISTSVEKANALKFLDLSNAEIKALIQIEIPIDKLYLNKCPLCYIGDLSEFKNEKECLISSGAFMKVEEVTKITEKIYEINLRIIEWGWKDFGKYIEEQEENEGSKINLALNNLGKIHVNDMKKLVQALGKSKNRSLNLFGNDLGSGNPKNSKYLSESLMKNQNLTSLNVS